MEQAHRYAPSRPVLVVGGGPLGRALMRRFPDAVILETDPLKIPRLREEFGAYRVYHGSGAERKHLQMAGLADAQAVVLATDDAEVNHMGGRFAKAAGIRQVIATVQEPAMAARLRKAGVEPVAASLSVAQDMIESMLTPRRRGIAQGTIAQDAPTDGVPVRDLRLDTDAVIVSILRKGDLITPDEEVRLRAGDVVTVMAHKEELADTLVQITGQEEMQNPIDRFYVPLLSPGALRGVYREAFLLAEYADAELFVFAPEDQAEVALEAQRLAEQAGVAFQMRLVARKMFVADAMEEIRRQDEGTGHGGLGERLFFECLVLGPDRSSTWRRWFRRRPMDRFLHRLDHPVLIARNGKKYRRILLVIDNTRRASMTVHHTVDLALVHGSRITALLPESAGGDEAYRLLRHLKRTGKIYGVQVDERPVRGNPTLEFIVEAKSGDYDLIVVDWQGRSIKRDILRRVIEHGPRSVLVLP